MALDMGKDKIRVNSISPAWIWSPEVSKIDPQGTLLYKVPSKSTGKNFVTKYTAFTCIIYNKILLKVLDPRNRGNLLLILQFFVLYLDFFL